MLEEEDLSYQIRACIFEVYRVLGGGFLEKVYERALLKELRDRGIRAHSQVPIAVCYKGQVVGEYYADLVVEAAVVLELKAQESLPRFCEGQLINYLRATGKRLGFLVNFAGPRATVRRLVL